MSGVYIERLRAIRDELEGAKTAIAYVSKNFDKGEVIRELGQTQLSRAYLEQIGKNLELTYFVRLTAEFEGILKDHLLTNYPSHAYTRARAAWKIDRLFSAVWQKESLPQNLPLRQKLDEIRDYSNMVAHRGAPVTPVTFGEALKRYNTFLAQLPEPRS